MKKRINITMSFVVDEENKPGLSKFHLTLSKCIDMFKADFNGEVSNPQGGVTIEDYEDAITQEATEQADGSEQEDHHA